MDQQQIVTNFNSLKLNEESKVIHARQTSCEKGAVPAQTNVRVAMLGNVDSGKSTTTAVLISRPGDLDDGRGTKRQQVFNFQHEVNNGRTSSIGHELMGFTEDGSQYFTKHDHTTRKNKIWPDIVANSSKIVHLLDMCGHEKYLKTTMHGLTSLFPDYAMVVVGGNMGVSRMTKEHLAIALTLDLPVIVVVTKVDISPQTVLKQNLEKVGTLLKQHCGKIPVLVKDDSNIDKIAEKIQTGKVAPIFTISNQTGEGVEMLRTFMSKLTKTASKITTTIHKNIHTQFAVDDSYQSKGLGLILCGSVTKGIIEEGQQMMFGPDRHGNFKTVVVKGIHENRVPIAEASAGMQVTLKVKQTDKDALKITQNQIRKGSFLINPLFQTTKGKNPYHEVCARYFTATIKVRNYHTTVQENYQAVMHIGGVRQTVSVVQIKD